MEQFMNVMVAIFIAVCLIAFFGATAIFIGKVWEHINQPQQFNQQTLNIPKDYSGTIELNNQGVRFTVSANGEEKPQC